MTATKGIATPDVASIKTTLYSQLVSENFSLVRVEKKEGRYFAIMFKEGQPYQKVEVGAMTLIQTQEYTVKSVFTGRLGDRMVVVVCGGERVTVKSELVPEIGGVPISRCKLISVFKDTDGNKKAEVRFPCGVKTVVDAKEHPGARGTRLARAAHRERAKKTRKEISVMEKKASAVPYKSVTKNPSTSAMSLGGRKVGDTTPDVSAPEVAPAPAVKKAKFDKHANQKKGKKGAGKK